MAEDVDDRLRRVEHTLWGPWLDASNGMVKDIKVIRGMIEEQQRKALTREEEQRQERKTDRRWWIGTVLAVIMAILAAASIMAGSL